MSTTYTSYAQRLRDKANAYRDHAEWLDALERKDISDEFLDLAQPYTSDTTTFTINLTEKDSIYNEVTEEWVYTINEAKTQDNIAAFKRACSPGIIQKEIKGDKLRYRKVYDTYTLEGVVDREVVCKPKEIKKVWHEPYTSKGYFSEEVVSWTCDDEDTEV